MVYEERSRGGGGRVAVRPSCSCRFRRRMCARAERRGRRRRGVEGAPRARARDPAAVALPLSLPPESRASARPSLRRTRARVLARPRRTAGVVLRRAPTLINAKLQRCAYFPARQAISSRDEDGDTRARACARALLPWYFLTVQVDAWKR